MSDTTSPNLPAALPWDDGVYSIKRHGVSLTNCDSEPVQIPGCIQAHGALLALRVSDLTILQASENTLEHLGRAPEDLLGQTVSTVFGASANVRLREMLAHEPIERNALHAFTHPANGKRPSLNACLHTVDGLALLEFDADGQHATGASADTFAPVRSAVQRLQSVGSLRDFCSALAQEVRNLTHLDRVMVYRFHPDNHGEVFAECKREDLANMGVAASLTMSLMCDGELWGLIACHHCSPTQFHYSVRAACEFLAQVASLQLKSAEKREQLVYRLRIEGAYQALVGQAAVDGDLMALTDREPSLRDAVDCGGAALRHLDRWWCVGDTPSNAQLDTLADWLDDRPEFSSATRPVLAIDQLSRDFPAATNMVTSASGILAVPLSRQRRDLMVWFRPPADLTVWWAGNPQDKPLVPGPNGSRLTPRSSFTLFVESVRGRSLPWSQMEVDSALRLRMLVMELVVSRAERLAELNADLTRSNDELDAFAYVASHDLKEPLRGIHKYAHQLLESAQALDSENRRRVDALMRLTLRMDSLPDSLLHFSRVGRTTLELEVVDLTTLLDEDYDTVLEAMRRSGAPNRIVRADSGDAGLRMLETPTPGHSGRVALVLMDLNTAKGDGREALRSIRMHGHLRALPVVVLSASANPRDVRFCYDHGANAYHIKPVSHPEHLQLLQNILVYGLNGVVLPDWHGVGRR